MLLILIDPVESFFVFGVNEVYQVGTTLAEVFESIQNFSFFVDFQIFWLFFELFEDQ